MAIVVNVVAGAPAWGLWCPICLKPSGYAVPLYFLTTQGVTSLGPVRKCHDCGAPVPPEDDEG
ncbi:hypothetical protein [Mycobacterium palustre]|uniref:hypothetical protein n=1 Tax=Mycobacterium palustre TaxID=153971 RepID=UPI000A14F0A5|nr:hypothetical protein [Mycobacterium palustre]MCV7100972.1 hypothetical protein [Mycobacterium palustre]